MSTHNREQNEAWQTKCPRFPVFVTGGQRPPGFSVPTVIRAGEERMCQAFADLALILPAHVPECWQASLLSEFSKPSFQLGRWWIRNTNNHHPAPRRWDGAPCKYYSER